MENQAPISDSQANHRAMRVAAHLGSIPELTRLLNAGVSINAQDQSSFDATPLIAAAAKGHLEVVDFLLHQGANVNLSESGGETALWWAIKGFHQAVVLRLLAAGADPNVKDEVGETALMWAVELGQEAIVPALLQAGAKVNAKSRKGKTAWFLALASERLDIAKMLDNAGATDF